MAAGVVLVAGVGSGAEVTALGPLGGRPILAWAVDALRAGAGIGEVAVVPCGPGIDAAAVARALEPASPDVRVLAAAPSRHAALHDVLSTLDSRTEIVVLHDADRPLVPVAVVSRVVAAVLDGASAAAPVVEVTETVKEIRADGRVTRTVPRESLLRRQTPYAVRRTLLDAAHARCSPADTIVDPPGALVPPGTPLTPVPGDHHAFPITDPASLALAEAVLAAAERHLG